MSYACTYIRMYIFNMAEFSSGENTVIVCYMYMAKYMVPAACAHTRGVSAIQGAGFHYKSTVQ